MEFTAPFEFGEIFGEKPDGGFHGGSPFLQMNLVRFQTAQAVQLFQNGPLPLHQGGELRVDLL